MATLAALSFKDPLSILYAVIGLGFVIFVHELGHFAVAKWCGVRVERFSIGFGPVIWSVIRGETEYALSIVPFGGYVKMLGQDDVDPNQMTSDDIAQDPRSYTAKTVPQRMAIISAGVIMNLITGSLFFAGCFMLGLEDLPAIVGATSPGSPAWVAGLQPGDRITGINGYDVLTFSDITRRVTLSAGAIKIEGAHRDGKKFDLEVSPLKKQGVRRTIGVAPAQGLTFNTEVGEDLGVADPGTPAAEAKPPFAPGDVIKSVAGTPVADHAALEVVLAHHRDKPVDFVVERKADPQSNKAEEVSVSVGPNPFRTLGLHMDIGQISAIEKNSPAEGKLQIGDKITHIISGEDQVREVGRDLNPLQVPDYLAGLHGQKIKLRVKREVAGTDGREVEEELVPVDRPGWIEYPMGEDAPLSAPAVGVAFYVLHSVLEVEPGSPAETNIKAKESLKRLELVLPAGVARDRMGDKAVTVEFSDSKRNWRCSNRGKKTSIRPNPLPLLPILKPNSPRRRRTVISIPAANTRAGQSNFTTRPRASRSPRRPISMRRRRGCVH